MADFYGSNYPNPTLPNRTIRDFKGARVRNTPSYALPGSAPALNDRILLARIPSNARLLAAGTIQYGAFGGSAACNLGLMSPKMTAAQITSGAAVLWSAQSVVSAGSRSVTAGVSLANQQKRVWELAGLSADPGGEFEIYLTFSTAAASAVAVQADVMFVTD